MIISEKIFESSSPSSIDILKRHFPNCFDKNGNFLPEKMAEQVQSQGINASREYYTMNWLGKSYARYLRDCPPATLLAENVAHNSLPENQHSQNLLIKGDNLEVLKHLKHAYAGEVKMIYIDPPYNTGSDGFVYQDDRKFTPEQLADLANMSLEEAKRVLDFTAKKSNSHSAWLTFMYPRLYIARELLKDDGVIFISIDDNEQAQLKLLCDEVFGEGNFVGIFIKKSKIGGGNDSSFIVKEHEYCFCYAKNMSFLNNMTIKHNEDYLKRYKEEDENGRYFWDTFARPGLKKKEDETLIYDIECPDGRKIKSRWIRSEKRFQEEYQKGIIRIIKKDDGDWSVQFKQYLNSDGKKPRSMTTDFGGTADANDDINSLFDAKIFSYPKSVKFISTLLQIINDKNSLIMDFFAGSGTTAHAVMQLNAEDGGNRRYIMVQLPEETDKKSEAYKAGYKTIFDITKARIEKAAIKIQSENPEFEGDLGFKIFETAENFLTVSDEEFHPIQPSLPETVDRVLSDEEYRTLLTTWRLYDGNALTESVQAVDLGGYVANRCGDNLYLLTPYFGSEQIKALLDKLDSDPTFLPKRMVLFGRNIDSAKQMELHQAVKTYANKKNIELNIVVRY